MRREERRSIPTMCLLSVIVVIQNKQLCACLKVSVCFVLMSVCVLFHRLVLTCVFCQLPWLCVCTELIKCLFSVPKVGFDPHPHMRVPGMPPSLTGIPGGKP